MQYFKMTKQEYADYVKKKSPASKTVGDSLRAFVTGGTICAIGQGFYVLYGGLMSEEQAAMLTSISLIFLGGLLTGLGLYDDIARFGGAGTLVPITGFANAMIAPAMEFKTEGFVTGTATKMFVIVGPVIVYGISSSVVYGIILWVLQRL